MSASNEAMEKAFSTKKRNASHKSCLGFFPQYQIKLPGFIFAQGSSDSFRFPKLVNAIHELTLDQTIIGRYQHHFTTWKNLQSIIRSGSIYGQDSLKKQGIDFEPNALRKCDISNGDGDVICFSPYMVDSIAFCEEKTVIPKKGAIRITIDTDRIASRGASHQFFKLFDLHCPEFDEYTVHVNERLSFSIVKWESLMSPEKSIYFYFIFDQQKYSLRVFGSSDLKSKSASIVYGNRYTINRFCLIKFLEFLEILKNDRITQEKALFVEPFLEYIESLPLLEIKKILVIFAQTLTVFSELNYNSQLQLTNGLITEIHDLNHSETLVLSDLNPDHYQSHLNRIAESGESYRSDVPIRKEQLLVPGKEEEYSGPFHKTTCPVITLNGTKILHREYSAVYIIPDQDLRLLSPELFAEGYYETRPGLGDSELASEIALRMLNH